MIKFPIYVGKYSRSESIVLGRGKKLVNFLWFQAESIFFSQAALATLRESFITALYRKNLIDECGERRKTLWLNKGLMYLHDNYTLRF